MEILNELGIVGNIYSYIGNCNIKISKTIIKGQREVKQLIGIIYDKYKFPKLEYVKKLYPSEKTLQEFDGELLYQSRRGETLFDNYENYINIKFNNKLEYIKIINQFIDKNNTLTIIVDKTIEEENTENKFNYDEIMKLHADEINKYWEEFLKKHEKDSSKVALIDMYKTNGMELENIVDIIESNKECILNNTLSYEKVLFNEMKKNTTRW